MLKTFHKSALLCAVLGLFVGTAALAQSDYPNRTIRMVVPFPAGGGTDIVARAVAEHLTAALGQPVVIENRGGGGTIIGTDAVAKAAPDGYTVLLTSSAFTINPSLVPNLPYDTEKDLLPIANASMHPFVLVANPSLPVNNLSELISYARKNPGKLSYASVGNGSSQHIEMEMLKQAAGLFIVHVPYRGSAPAVTDLLGGQVQLMFNGISPTLQHIRAGKLKALAVDSEKRVPLLKDVPTVAESGLPNLRFTTWSGLLVPARTPKPVVDRLTAEMQKITSSPEFREKLASMGLEAGGPTGAAYASFLKADMGDWARMVKQSNAKLD
jgi:tripartite-type tricarboxylate transporter receptor subunit TctC